MGKYSEIQDQFNNKKYIKGYKDWDNSYNKSFHINQTKLRIGDKVEIDSKVEKWGGKKGFIIPKFSKKDPDSIGVKLENGKKVLIDKKFLTKIAKEFEE